ncbi:MAG TPA: cation:proton antiporter subunit C [Mycobacterium sp.]|nr:cation:proton antiporter subunit C [Mycobacterium sp.]
MTIYAYGVAGWLVLIGAYGIVVSRHLVHAVICVSVSQSGTYVMLLAVGYQRGASAPIFDSNNPPTAAVVDPTVQAMSLTDIVVTATVIALLLALVIQIHKRHGTVDPDELSSLRG